MKNLNKMMTTKTESINTYLMAPVNNNRRAIVVLDEGVKQKKIKSFSKGL